MRKLGLSQSSLADTIPITPSSLARSVILRPHNERGCYCHPASLNSVITTLQYQVIIGFGFETVTNHAVELSIRFCSIPDNDCLPASLRSLLVRDTWNRVPAFEACMQMHHHSLTVMPLRLWLIKLTDRRIGRRPKKPAQCHPAIVGFLICTPGAQL